MVFMSTKSVSSSNGSSTDCEDGYHGFFSGEESNSDSEALRTPTTTSTLNVESRTDRQNQKESIHARSFKASESNQRTTKTEAAGNRDRCAPRARVSPDLTVQLPEDLSEAQDDDEFQTRESEKPNDPLEEENSATGTGSDVPNQIPAAVPLPVHRHASSLSTEDITFVTSALSRFERKDSFDNVDARDAKLSSMQEGTHGPSSGRSAKASPAFRYMGGKLRFPLVRLTGRSTKVADCLVDEQEGVNPFSRLPSGKATPAKPAKRTKNVKSAMALPWQRSSDPSSDDSLAIAGAHEPKAPWPPREPQTQFSTRKRSPDAPPAPPTPPAQAQPFALVPPTRGEAIATAPEGGRTDVALSRRGSLTEGLGVTLSRRGSVNEGLGALSRRGSLNEGLGALRRNSFSRPLSYSAMPKLFEKARSLLAPDSPGMRGSDAAAASPWNGGEDAEDPKASPCISAQQHGATGIGSSDITPAPSSAMLGPSRAQEGRVNVAQMVAHALPPIMTGTASSSSRQQSDSMVNRDKDAGPDLDSDFQDVDQEVVESLREKANLLVYVRTGGLLTVMIPDVLCFILLQLLSPGPVFLCQARPAPGGIRLQGWGTEPNLTNLGFLGAVLLLNAWFLVCEVRGQNGGGLRGFVSREKQGGWKASIWNIMYLVVLVLSVVMGAVAYLLCSSQDEDFGSALRVQRAHMLVHLWRIICLCEFCRRFSHSLRKRLQSVVSMNKRRFVDKDHGLDLDLTYICDRLIAMALPCVCDVLYRNDMQQVSRFFASRHYGHFMVLNLCRGYEESGNGNYNPGLLYNQVQKLPMNDHHAPFMHTLVYFLEAATDFLNQHRSNVVAVHCRGGKGRTGTFCASLLLWVARCQTAEEAMKLFAKRRTMPGKGTLQGVDAPCQKRYVRYLEQMIYHGVDTWSRNPMLMIKVVISCPPADTPISVIVEEQGSVLYDSAKEYGATGIASDAMDPSSNQIEIRMEPLLLNGDVTVRIFALSDGTNAMKGFNGQISHGGTRIRYNSLVRGRLLGFVQFHTAFVDGDLIFPKEEIDGAYADKEHRAFSRAFGVSLSLSRGARMDRLDAEQAQQWVHSAGRFPPALTLLRLEQSLAALMERLAPREEVLHQDQIVFDSRTCSAGELCYLVAGEVRFESVIERNLNANGVLGVSDAPFMGTVGAGNLLGMGEMLLGSGASPFGTIFVAKTATVSVRRFKLPSSAHGPHIPLEEAAQGAGGAAVVSPADADGVFHLLAQNLSRQSAKLSAQVLFLTELSNVKHEYGVGMSMSDRAQLVHSVLQQYQIPITERVLAFCDATAEEKGQGYMLLLREWLIFRPKNSNKQEQNDLLVPVKSIFRSRLEKEKLIICCRKSDEDADDTVSPRLLPEDLARPRLLSMVSSDGGDDSWHPHTRITPRAGTSRQALKQLGQSTSSLINSLRRSPEKLALARGAVPQLRREESGAVSTPALRPAVRSPTRKPRRSVHGVDFDEYGEYQLTFPEGVETAMLVQEALEKQRAIQREEASPPPTLLGSGGEAEMQRILEQFALVLPGEHASDQDRLSLAQLLTPLRRRRFAAGAEIFAEGDQRQALGLLVAGKVSARNSKNIVIEIINVGELVGRNSFWGQGNRGKSVTLVAETDVEMQWLELENVEIISSGRPSVSARIFRCLATCMARRVQTQLHQLLQVEQSISESAQLETT